MTNRSMVRGTTEYLEVTVNAQNVTLNTQVVEFSFDNETWTTAAWTGSAANVRTAQLLLTPATTPPDRNNKVYVRVTDSPEIPDLFAGFLYVME